MGSGTVSLFYELQQLEDNAIHPCSFDKCNPVEVCVTQPVNITSSDVKLRNLHHSGYIMLSQYRHWHVQQAKKPAPHAFGAWITGGPNRITEGRRLVAYIYVVLLTPHPAYT